MTHIGSGWEKLRDYLELNPRVHVFSTGLGYHHPEDVSALTLKSHRRENSAAIWADVILHNKDFTMRRLCDYYKIIFWACSFAECEAELKGIYGSRAELYWKFRMAGLKQYFRATQSLWNPVLQGDFLP